MRALDLWRRFILEMQTQHVSGIPFFFKISEVLFFCWCLCLGMFASLPQGPCNYLPHPLHCWVLGGFSLRAERPHSLSSCQQWSTPQAAMLWCHCTSSRNSTWRHRVVDVPVFFLANLDVPSRDCAPFPPQRENRIIFQAWIFSRKTHC